MTDYQDIYVGKREMRSEPSAVPFAYDRYEPYIPDEQLVQAINLAIYLNRPLLLEGEAGSGKSRLARSLAYELGLPLYIWDVRSTSKGQDGLYTYDALLRLHDVNVSHDGTGAKDVAKNPEPPFIARDGYFVYNPAAVQKAARDPGNAQDYRRLGPLGKAFANRGTRSVVLIDEVDKAEIDFPNDLLAALEEQRFYIHETGEMVDARDDNNKQAPIIIITSNKEKGNLPKPFLRRCIYHFIKFPDEKRLKDIIALHHKRVNGTAPDPEIVDKALPLFSKIRASKLQKPPSTSELLDWIQALHYYREKSAPADIPAELVKNVKIPYTELLYKLRTDLARLETDTGSNT